MQIAVVGAGWSGLACALSLTSRDCAVMLIDAAPRAGGRARRLDLSLGDRRYALDNGQHLMLGAYRDCLRLMAEVGVDVARSFLRQPFALSGSDGMRLRAARLPAPFHLVAALTTARGLGLADRIGLARDVFAWKRADWKAPAERTAACLLVHSTPKVRRRIWQPLCLAALNATLDEASAQIFLNVLRDSLGAGAGACDLLIARTDLSALFVDAALAHLQRSHAEIALREPVLALARERNAGWSLRLRDDVRRADRIVLALPPSRAAALLKTLGEPALDATIGQLDAIEMAPIATVYLRYAAAARLPAPCMTLNEDRTRKRFGQWVFDRGALQAASQATSQTDCAGVLSVVISGRGPHLGLPRAALGELVARQVSEELGLPAPIAHYATVDKHATIVPRPQLSRPPIALPLDGLFLAGDAADNPYPSTLEGSVRSGIAAARAALKT
jgi:squalene-associated FAD-dependent desaturase